MAYHEALSGLFKACDALNHSKASTRVQISARAFNTHRPVAQPGRAPDFYFQGISLWKSSGGREFESI